MVDDPCHSTLEMYKFLVGSLADRHWQAAAYQQFRERLEAGQRCCPALREKAAALKPGITDPGAVESVPLPIQVLIAGNGPCARHFAYAGEEAAPTPLSQAWADTYNAERQASWKGPMPN